MRPVSLPAVIAATLILLVVAACTHTRPTVEQNASAIADLQAWQAQFEADCTAEQQAVLARLISAEDGEDRTQDEERSVCGQSISADGAAFTFADATVYTAVNSDGGGDDSTGWLEQAAGAAEALHGLLEGVDEEVYQLERAAAGELDLSDPQVAEAVADGVADVTAAAAKAEMLVGSVGDALTRLGDLAASVTVPDPTTTTTTTTMPAPTTTTTTMPTTTTTTPPPSTTTTTAAAMPDPDGPWVIVYSTEPYDYENGRWPGPVEVLQWTVDGPFLFAHRADAEEVLAAILDWAAAGSDDESTVNQHFGIEPADSGN